MGNREANNYSPEEQLSDSEDITEDADLDYLFHNIFTYYPGPSPQLIERIMLIIQMQRDLILLEDKQTPINPIFPQSDTINSQA